MNARGIDFTGLAYLAALAAIGYGIYRLAKAGPAVAKNVGEAVTKALDTINPANPQNLAHTAATATVAKATGDQYATPGVKLWEWLNPGTRKLEKQMLGTAGDADIGRAMLDRVNSTAAWSPIDQEDRDLGTAMAGGNVSP